MKINKEKVSQWIYTLTGTTKDSDVRPKEVFSYSIAGFGQNLLCAFIASFLMLFLTDAVGLDGAWLAWLFLGVRLFDAFNDPIMGTIVDHTRSKNGDKLRPYLKFTPIPIAIMTILCFVNLGSGVSDVAKFSYIAIVYTIWSVVYTIVDVPYWGLSTAMVSDTEKRNIMLTVARLLCTLGSGIVTVLIPMLTGALRTATYAKVIANNQGNTAIINAVEQIKGNPNIEISTDSLKAAAEQIRITEAPDLAILFAIIAVVIGIVSVPMFFIGYKNSKERFKSAEKPKSLGHNLQLLFKNRPLMLIVLSGILGAGRYVYMTSGIYYAKYILHNQSLFSIITLLVVPGGLVASVLTPYFSKKFGKKNVYIFSHLIGGAALLLLYFLGIKSNGADIFGSRSALYGIGAIVILLVGIPSGFANILSYAMIADTVDYLEDKTGERAEGICFAMQTFISKIGMALVAFVTLIVLSKKSGYIEGQINQPENINKNIWLVTMLIPAASTILSTVPLFFYRFTEAKQKEAVARVAERRAMMFEAEINAIEVEPRS